MSMKFIDRINEELAKQKMLPIDLANRGNLSPSTVSRVMNGKMEPGDKFIQAVSKAFDVPVTEVYRWAGKIPPVDERDEWTAIMLHKMTQLEEFPFLRRLAEKYLDSLIAEKPKKNNPIMTDVESQRTPANS